MNWREKAAACLFLDVETRARPRARRTRARGEPGERRCGARSERIRLVGRREFFWTGENFLSGRAMGCLKEDEEKEGEKGWDGEEKD